MKSIIGKGWPLFLLLFFSHISVAATFTATGVSTILPCPSFCEGTRGGFDIDSDGGEGVTSPFSSLHVVARGSDVPRSTDHAIPVFEILALDTDNETQGEDRATLTAAGTESLNVPSSWKTAIRSLFGQILLQPE